MDERLSLKAVDDYSEDYASKVAAAFFASKDVITGPEILQLCSIQQINLFVIRELLNAWKHEGQKLRSPYFDYNAPDVKSELGRLQNVLSNHISISKENFQPLLKKAVALTLYLIIDPYDYFSDTLDRQGSNHVRANDLRSEIKYLKINRPPLEKLVQRLDERKLELVSGKEAFGLLDTILEEVNFTPEDVEAYATEFSKIVPLSYEKLYEKKPMVNVTKAIAQEPAKKKSAASKTLVDDFQKVGRIKDSLTINQKFMFTKILFKGDFEIFTEAIEKVDKLNSLENAMGYFEQNFPEWDKESEEYEEFIELVEKRFA